MRKTNFLLLAVAAFAATACHNDDDASAYEAITDPYAAITATFGTNIDPDNLLNYASQSTPGYVNKDNTAANPITDKGAMLGRVLFYDKNLSADNTIACAGCHKQEHAFSDLSLASTGVNGTTGRHAMRLVNNRFANEAKFFWNERALTLKQQTTTPVKDHAEMGFSGLNGDPSIDDLVAKLAAIDYYKELFTFVYGTDEVTEDKIQSCLAQFISSIQSFDSKYDTGRALTGADQPPFSNFTPQENLGKMLFLAPAVFNAQGVRTDGGVGCAGCHQPPEFDIDPNALNNGVIGILGAAGTDLGNTRAPSLRDVVKPDGSPNGPFMHTAEFATLQEVIAHYNSITVSADNPDLDNRLMPNGHGQQLNLTDAEIEALVAFLQTASGTDVYTDVRWSDPFLP